MSTALEGNSPRIAVIDIGSNSIHLLVMGMDAMGKLLSIDSEKIILRLGETLDPEGNFPPGVRKSLIESLRLLHEIAYCYQPIMRIIASHAVRVAANQAELLAEIKNELGLEISVINGREEARLVALGMHYAAATQEKAFFGCDLGGGSTELFKVLRGKIVEASSQAIGTVTLNQHFIRGANDLDAALRRAEQHAESIFAPLAAQFPRSNDLALLSSSVGKTLVELARRQHQGTGINDSHGSILSDSTIASFYQQIALLGSPDKICQQWDLDPDKAELLLAGTCLLHCLSRCFGIKRWTISTYGLREGLVLDMFEKLGFREQIKKHGQQIAWFNVQSLSRQLLVDQIQAQRVSDCAIGLYDQLVEAKALPAAVEGEDELRKLLRAAAWLHECGKLVHFTRYHRHSHYLIINSQLMGFSEREKHFISLIARYHNHGRISRKDLDFKILGEVDLKKVNFLAAILRLAVSAHRSRQGEVKGIAIVRNESGLLLRVKGRRLKVVSLDFQKIIRDKDSLEQSLELAITCSLEAGKANADQPSKKSLILPL